MLIIISRYLIHFYVYNIINLIYHTVRSFLFERHGQYSIFEYPYNMCLWQSAVVKRCIATRYLVLPRLASLHTIICVPGRRMTCKCRYSFIQIFSRLAYLTIQILSTHRWALTMTPPIFLFCQITYPDITYTSYT